MNDLKQNFHTSVYIASYQRNIWSRTGIYRMLDIEVTLCYYKTAKIKQKGKKKGKKAAYHYAFGVLWRCTIEMIAYRKR